MNLRALGNILHNGTDYKRGDIISGLTDEEQARLIILKTGEAVDDLSEERIELVRGMDSLGLQMNRDAVLTTEQFSELKAEDQKSYLKALNIDPAGKENERIAQYEDWFAEQVTNDYDA